MGLRWYWWLAIAVVVLAALQATSVVDFVGPVVDFTKRGPKFTDKSDIDTYFLAAMIRSEAGTQNEIAKLGVAWAANNAATRKGKSVADFLTNGQFTQSSQNTGGRYASTNQDPYEIDATIAKTVLTGQGIDPTQGSIQFDSPKAQRALLARNEEGYSKTPEQVADARMAAGLEMVTLEPAISADNLRFWKPKG